MISERPRNIIVGLTFLAALALCMYGIILLGKFPFFGAIHQYALTLRAANANGVSTGSKVEFNGVYAGQVESTWLSPDDKGNLVVFVRINIDPKINIPASASASLQRPATVGNPYVSLNALDAKGPMLPKDGSAVLEAAVGDSSLIPKEVFTDISDLKDELTALSRNLTTVAKDLHVLLAYTPPEALENVDPNDPNAPRANASTVIIRLDRTVASLQTLLTDPKLQGQVRDAVQNIADAATQLKAAITNANNTINTIGNTATSFDKTLANANTMMGNVSSAAAAFGGASTQATAAIQATQKDIGRVAQQLVETLVQLDKSLREITEGKGTTGQLVNDPRLYEGLVDLSKSLKSTVDDLDFLLNKWKEEGVNLKLK